MTTPEKRKKHFLEISLLTHPHSCLHEADIGEYEVLQHSFLLMHKCMIHECTSGSGATAL